MDEQNHRIMDRRTLLVRGGAATVGAVGVTVAGVATAAPALAAGLMYNPVAPYRSYDSRDDSDGKLAAGFGRFVQVANAAKDVPLTAVAVTFNLTITETEGRGYLGVVPAESTDFSVSTINWVVPGLDLANGGTTKIGKNSKSDPGSVAVYCESSSSGKTHFIIDVTGFFA